MISSYDCCLRMRALNIGCLNSHNSERIEGLIKASETTFGICPMFSGEAKLWCI
jgi:hypothetical protein